MRKNNRIVDCPECRGEGGVCWYDEGDEIFELCIVCGGSGSLRSFDATQYKAYGGTLPTYGGVRGHA